MIPEELLAENLYLDIISKKKETGLKKVSTGNEQYPKVSHSGPFSWSIYCLKKSHQRWSQQKGSCQEDIIKEENQKEKNEVCQTTEERTENQWQYVLWSDGGRRAGRLLNWKLVVRPLAAPGCMPNTNIHGQATNSKLVSNPMCVNIMVWGCILARDVLTMLMELLYRKVPSDLGFHFSVWQWPQTHA